MKQLRVTDPSQCMACLQCGNACSNSFYKTPNITLSCIQITEPVKGKLVVETCDQCGKCAEVCPANAITANAKGVYMINKKLCLGCGACVGTCPKGLIVQAVAGEAPSKCIACGICAKQCPMQILEVVDL